MHRPAMLALFTLLTLGAPAARGVTAQEAQSLSDREPRFLVASRDGPRAAPTRVDIAQTPVLMRRIAVRFADATLDAALRTIAERSGLQLAYSTAMIPPDRRVRLKADDITVAGALSEVLRDMGVDVLLSGSGKAVLVRRREAGLLQAGAIAGRVTDAKRGDGLGGVEVSLDGTRWHVATGSDGHYRLDGVTLGSYTLVARRIGYGQERRAVTVTDAQVAALDVALTPRATVLEEVVVTGSLVPTEVKAIPHPVTVVMAADIERLHLTNVNDIVRIMVPGASVTPATAGSVIGPDGVVGNTGIKLRGATSFIGTASGVKIFVDGIQTFGSVTISPEIIERVEVIRGPEAASLYGTDALSGVIQIFTKRGRDAGARPDLSLQAEARRVETAYEDGGTLGQQYTANLAGTSGSSSYRVGGGYDALGAFVPEYRYRGAHIETGLRVSQGRFLADASVLYRSLLTRPSSTSPTALDLVRGTPVEASFIAQGIEYSAPLTSYTARLEYRLTNTWKHQLTAGIDRYANQGRSYRPRLATPGDTLLTDNFLQVEQRTAAYQTTLTLRGERLTTTFTAGGDYKGYSSLQSGTSQALSLEPFQLVAGGTGYYTPTARTRSLAGYGQAQVGWLERLFLTGSLRSEETTVMGANTGTQFAGLLGASFVWPLGQTTMKMRTSYGKAIRAPFAVAIYGLPGVATLLPHPDVRPEQQRGWDAGVDVELGGRVSGSVTYYRQIARDFLTQLQVVTLPGRVFRYENVGRVRNTGLEVEGRVNLGNFSVQGNITASSSKPTDLGGVAERYDIKVGQQITGVPTRTEALTLSAQLWRGTGVSASFAYRGSVNNVNYFEYYACTYHPQPSCPTGSSLAPYYQRLPGVPRLKMGVDQSVTRSVTAYLTVDDLTNEADKYASGSNFGAFVGRTATFGVRARF